ncbi:unnamed protein product [Didymodactylos carnosus]|uniref:Initiation-specific alpha-1,6-mannosyltransferase n=1 Tax=Didymodactylos carnosus TaxID=1234261 RepID=A0A815VLV0_9BILA|nr:unnamed protein product [Didymodactylos carnosus]CAF1534587.1 unnamed protein product [Didymodactylos carnosus]CAF4274793.1 unnamed protein product [Didymodactylos carnosus]CAF4394277.1 unnamed protein product [Didymodactylos carnosus]
MIEKIKKTNFLIFSFILLTFLFSFAYNAQREAKRNEILLSEPLSSMTSCRYRIPRLIHQTVKSKLNISKDTQMAIQSWQLKNPQYRHLLYDDQDLEQFVINSYPHLLPLFREKLKTQVERTDLWRYLVLHEYGGIYTDSDTICVQPIDEWPIDNHTELVIGIEANMPNHTEVERFKLVYSIQFMQWTIVAKPKHPLLFNVFSRIDEYVNNEQNDYDSSKMGVLKRTGPGMFTQVINDYLNKTLNLTSKDVVNGGTYDHKRLKIVNINGFGAGQPHSHSASLLSLQNRTDIYAYHLFHGGWKKSYKIKN